MQKMCCFHYFAVVFLLLAINSFPAIFAFADNCTVEGIPSNDFLTYHMNKNDFHDDYAGIVAEYPSTGITGVHIDQGTYLGVSIKDGNIVIETTDHFSNFEKENAPIHGQISFSTYIIFECINGSSRLNFIQKVIDINNNDPYFNKEYFEFKYGMGLAQGFLLTEYFTVAGFDDDLTSGHVEYQISGDVLKITRATQGGDHSVITVSKDIEMPFDLEFIITVTDGGEEPFRSTTAKLRLILGRNQKLVVSPLFVKPLWIWQYDKGQQSIINSEQIALSQGFCEGLTIKQIGYEEFFETTLDDPATEKLIIQLKKSLTEDIIKEKRIFLHLEAECPKAKQIAKTTVLIEIV